MRTRLMSRPVGRHLGGELKIFDFMLWNHQCIQWSTVLGQNKSWDESLGEMRKWKFYMPTNKLDTQEYLHFLSLFSNILSLRNTYMKFCTLSELALSEKQSLFMIHISLSSNELQDKEEWLSIDNYVDIVM